MFAPLYKLHNHTIKVRGRVVGPFRAPYASARKRLRLPPTKGVVPVLRHTAKYCDQACLRPFSHESYFA